MGVRERASQRKQLVQSVRGETVLGVFEEEKGGGKMTKGQATSKRVVQGRCRQEAR